jgi:hypothetical protein
MTKEVLLFVLFIPDLSEASRSSCERKTTALPLGSVEHRPLLMQGRPALATPMAQWRRRLEPLGQ